MAGRRRPNPPIELFSGPFIFVHKATELGMGVFTGGPAGQSIALSVGNDGQARRPGAMPSAVHSKATRAPAPASSGSVCMTPPKPPGRAPSWAVTGPQVAPRPRNPRCPGIGVYFPDPGKIGIPDFPNPGFRPNRDSRFPEIRDSGQIGIQIRENPDFFLQRPEP